jgi:hypothetical protein
MIPYARIAKAPAQRVRTMQAAGQLGVGRRLRTRMDPSAEPAPGAGYPAVLVSDAHCDRLVASRSERRPRWLPGPAKIPSFGVETGQGRARSPNTLEFESANTVRRASRESAMFSRAVKIFRPQAHNFNTRAGDDPPERIRVFHVSIQKQLARQSFLNLGLALCPSQWFPLEFPFPSLP